MRMDVTGFVTFIGVDLHKRTVTLRAVRADGERHDRTKAANKAKAKRRARALQPA